MSKQEQFTFKGAREDAAYGYVMQPWNDPEVPIDTNHLERACRCSAVDRAVDGTEIDECRLRYRSGDLLFAAVCEFRAP